MFRVASLFVAIVLSTGIAQADPQTPTVEITGLRSTDGIVRVAVFDETTPFPGGEAITRIAVPAQDDRVVLTLTNLPSGRYAVAFFHDENANNEFDRGVFGLPLEGFGFSNDAQVLLGPPDFDEAAIDFAATDRISARMRY